MPAARGARGLAPSRACGGGVCGSAAVGSARWAGPGPGRAALLRHRGHHHVPATRPTTSACAGWRAEPHPALPGSLVRRGAGRRASPSGALAGVEDGDGRPARRGSVEVREGCGGLVGSLVDDRQRTGRPPAPSVGPAPARPRARSEQTRHRACVSGTAEEVGRRPPGVRPSPRVPPHGGDRDAVPPATPRGPARPQPSGSRRSWPDLGHLDRGWVGAWPATGAVCEGARPPVPGLRPYTDRCRLVLGPAAHRLPAAGLGSHQPSLPRNMALGLPRLQVEASKP